MRPSLALPAIVMVLAAAPTLATPCAEEVTTLQRRFDSAGAEAVTGERSPGGPTSSDSPKALDKPPQGKPSDPSVTPTAGGVAQAKQLLAKASEEDKAGKAEECRDTVLRAKEKAGALP